MIDNVVNMIEGIKNKVDTELLMVNSDPLGYFIQPLKKEHNQFLLRMTLILQ